MVIQKQSTLGKQTLPLPTLTEQYYRHILVDDFLLKGNYKTIMELPTIQKIVVNFSSKQIVSDEKRTLSPLLALEILTGQKAAFTKAKKPIATFKIRKNQPLGCKVTLRNKRKTFFFEKLTKILLPRLSNYQGTHINSFDDKGNLNIGIDTIFFFPELDSYYNYFENISGLDISIETSSRGCTEALFFLTSYQFPIKK